MDKMGRDGKAMMGEPKRKVPPGSDGKRQRTDEQELRSVLGCARRSNKQQRSAATAWTKWVRTDQDKPNGAMSQPIKSRRCVKLSARGAASSNVTNFST